MPPAHKTLEGQESWIDWLQYLTGERHLEVLSPCLQQFLDNSNMSAPFPFSEAVDSSLSTGQGQDGPWVSAFSWLFLHLLIHPGLAELLVLVFRHPRSWPMLQRQKLEYLMGGGGHRRQAPVHKLQDHKTDGTPSQGSLSIGGPSHWRAGPFSLVVTFCYN